MSWDTELVTIVRFMIDDIADPPKYDDDDLKTVILISANQVNAVTNFAGVYVTSIDDLTMTPDCTVDPDRSEAYINLVTLNTATFLVRNEIKLQSGQGIRIKDGTSEIDLRRDAAGLRLIYETYGNGYKDALFQYRLGALTAGEHLCGPFKTSAYNYWCSKIGYYG